jgi:dipeptidyl aminopeptidase/acylaminoacyl peptidase
MGAAPWENPQRYVQNSPVYYLDRVQTPLLIVAGGADKSFLEPSEQIFTDMQRLGKEATFLRYEGEGHGLKSYANLVDFWNRIVPFLDHYLKAPSELSAGSASGGAGEGPRR